MYIVLIVWLLFVSGVALALRDPTAPPGATPVSATVVSGDLKLQSIMISPTSKTILIGGRYLTIGDRIRGATIMAIEPNSVRLMGKRGEFTIELFQPIMKIPTDGARTGL